MQRKLESFLARIRPPVFPTAIAAHRGASAMAPENTLAAFGQALETGCEIVELDVFLTRDEEVVVIHDEKLGRTIDLKGRVAELSLAEIRAGDAGLWFGERFAGERVPRLDEALALIGRRAAPMIEVKQRLQRAPAALIEKLAAALEAADLAGTTILIVWDAESARRFRERLPGALIAQIAFTRRGIRRATEGGCDGVVPYFRSASARFIAESHEAGLFVAPWTINRAADLELFCRAGCDIVITDVPHTARDVIERLEAERAQRTLRYFG